MLARRSRCCQSRVCVCVCVCLSLASLSCRLSPDAGGGLDGGGVEKAGPAARPLRLAPPCSSSPTHDGRLEGSPSLFPQSKEQRCTVDRLQHPAAQGRRSGFASQKRHTSDQPPIAHRQAQRARRCLRASARVVCANGFLLRHHTVVRRPSRGRSSRGRARDSGGIRIRTLPCQAAFHSAYVYAVRLSGQLIGVLRMRCARQIPPTRALEAAAALGQHCQRAVEGLRHGCWGGTWRG